MVTYMSNKEGYTSASPYAKGKKVNIPAIPIGVDCEYADD